MTSLSKATDKQLITIIKSDYDCPIHLLDGVIQEMFKRNLFQGLIHHAINKKFRNIDIACRILKTTKEELYQIGNMTVFIALERYQTGRTSFAHFSHMLLLSAYRELEQKVKAEKRKVYEHIQSIDATRNEKGEPYSEILLSSDNVEKYVISKITWEEMTSVLSDAEKRALELYMKGYSFREIAKKENKVRTTIRKRFNQAMIKLTGKEVNLIELGIRNSKRGQTA